MAESENAIIETTAPYVIVRSQTTIARRLKD